MPPTTSQARRDRIVHLATTTGLASVEELSQLFDVTPSTIRRDLARLTTEGRLARTYGGAMALSAHPEASLRQRTGEAYEEKRAIAQWAARQVEPGETLLLDAGTTVGALAHELRGAKELTIVTTGLTALHALADAEGVHVECLGGTLRPLSQGFVGPPHGGRASSVCPSTGSSSAPTASRSTGASARRTCARPASRS